MTLMLATAAAALTASFPATFSAASSCCLPPARNYCQPRQVTAEEAVRGVAGEEPEQAAEEPEEKPLEEPAADAIEEAEEEVEAGGSSRRQKRRK